MLKLKESDVRPAAHAFRCLYVSTIHNREEWRKKFTALHNELVKVKNSADNLTRHTKKLLHDVFLTLFNLIPLLVCFHTLCSPSKKKMTGKNGWMGEK